MAGNYWNKTQGTPFYTADLSRPGDRFQWYESKAIRVTWQASEKNKFNFFADVADDCLCRAIGALGSAPEAGLAFHFRPTGLYQGDWKAPLTSKLLLEAGGSLSITHWPTFLESRRRAEPHLDPGALEQLPVQRVGDLCEQARNGSRRAASLGVVHHRNACVQGRHADRRGSV